VTNSSAAGGARAQVLAAATRLFAARGFEGTTIQAIADELGVTKTAVLHHFPSKDRLRTAVLDDMVEHWQRLLPGLLLRATESEDRFDAVFDELLAFFAREPDRAKLALREAFDDPREVRRVLRTTVRSWLEAIAHYVERGRESGDHHADLDAQAYVALVMLLVIAASSMTEIGSSVLDGDVRARVAREVKRIARASLFSKPGRGARTRR
jgi:AcrR family transcriptional regulator